MNTNQGSVTFFLSWRCPVKMPSTFLRVFQQKLKSAAYGCPQLGMQMGNPNTSLRRRGRGWRPGRWGKQLALIFPPDPDSECQQSCSSKTSNGGYRSACKWPEQWLEVNDGGLCGWGAAGGIAFQPQGRWASFRHWPPELAAQFNSTACSTQRLGQTTGSNSLDSWSSAGQLRICSWYSQI